MEKIKCIYTFLLVYFLCVTEVYIVEGYPIKAILNFSYGYGEIQIKSVLEEEELDIDIEEKDVHDDTIKILIFEGAEFRSAIKNEDRLWENGRVPYEISDAYGANHKRFILNAMEEFQNKTCVRFRPRKGEKSFIFIMPGRGCSAGLGNFSRVNRVNLGANCLVKGIVFHELMHTLGFIHEQNRPDRDEFVQVDFDNVRDGTERNFNKVKSAQTFNLTYDYGSVMHYGKFDFAKDRSKPTIIPSETGVEIGQRKGFSEKDLIKINLLYNCNSTQNSGNASAEILDQGKEQR